MLLTALTLTEKDEIRRFHASQDGITHCELVEYAWLKFKKRIGRSTVGKILSSKRKFNVAPTKYRQRISNYPDAERVLLEFVEEHQEEAALSAEILFEQARTLRPVSMSWIQRFKKRYGIKRITRHDEAASVNLGSLPSQ